MNDFTFYFKLGWQHIISWEAADHLLFIAALAAIYLVSNWKQVLILVTAFTIGHSCTLALSVYDIVRIKSSLVEFLIPLTIILTAIFNLVQKKYDPESLRLNFFLALLFGLVHGMGFANTIRFMLAKSQTIGIPLLGFNIGLEVGQVVVVTLILVLSFVLVNLAGLPRKGWVWALSVTALGFGTYMLSQRWPN